MSLGLEKENQNTNNSETGSEANTAGGNESQSNCHEEECYEEMERRYHNKIDDAKTFIDILYKKAPSPVAIQTACQDLSEQVTLATTEGDQEGNITGYSENLIQCLGKEKGPILELISYLNELSAGFKEYMEEGVKEREGLGIMADTSEKGEGGGETEGVSKHKGEEAGEAEEEEQFLDARDTGSITSTTCKTQGAAEENLPRAVTSAVPHSLAGEGGQ